MAQVSTYAETGADSDGCGRIAPTTGGLRLMALAIYASQTGLDAGQFGTLRMSDLWLISSFERNGEPRMLPNRDAAQSAIARGLIGPDTLVTVRGEAGERHTVPARDVPQFRELLGDLLAEPEPVGEAAAEPAREDSPPVAAPGQPAAAAGAGAGAADPAPRAGTTRSDQPALGDTAFGWQSPYPAPEPAARIDKRWLIGLLILLGLGLLWMVRQGSGSGTSTMAAADPAQLASESAAPASDAAQTDPAASPDPSASSGASATPSEQTGADCDRARDQQARLHCQQPELRASEGQLRNSWNSARRRMAGSGQQIESLSSIRQRIATCRTADCAARAYRSEARRLDQMQAPVAAPVIAPPVAAAPRCQPKGASPLGNPGNWVTSSDYPSAALRKGQTGIVGFQVDIGMDGRINGCRVTSSSGWADLDQATCRLVSRRARFNPATDGACQPALGSYSNRVRWTLPSD